MSAPKRATIHPSVSPQDVQMLLDRLRMSHDVGDRESESDPPSVVENIDHPVRRRGALPGLSVARPSGGHSREGSASGPEMRSERRKRWHLGGETDHLRPFPLARWLATVFVSALALSAIATMCIHAAAEHKLNPFHDGAHMRAVDNRCYQQGRTQSCTGHWSCSALACSLARSSGKVEPASVMVDFLNYGACNATLDADEVVQDLAYEHVRMLWFGGCAGFLAAVAVAAFAPIAERRYGARIWFRLACLTSHALSKVVLVMAMLSGIVATECLAGERWDQVPRDVLQYQRAHRCVVFLVFVAEGLSSTATLWRKMAIGKSRAE